MPRTSAPSSASSCARARRPSTRSTPWARSSTSMPRARRARWPLPLLLRGRRQARPRERVRQRRRPLLRRGEPRDGRARPAGRGFRAQRAAESQPRGESTLSLSLPRAGAAQVDLFGVDGRHLRRLLAGPQAAGELRLAWDGRDGEGRALPSGVYFARATAGGRAATLRLVLMRRAGLTNGCGASTGFRGQVTPQPDPLILEAFSRM